LCDTSPPKYSSTASLESRSNLVSFLERRYARQSLVRSAFTLF